MEKEIHKLMGHNNYSLVNENNTLLLTLHTIDGDFDIGIPSIIKKNNIELVDIDGVIRPIHSYILLNEDDELKVSFKEFILLILFGNPAITGVLKGRLPAITRVYKISNNRDKNYTRYIVNTIQMFINNIINNTLPLHTTDMNSWSINNRIDIIDSKFEEINDPNKKLKYQVKKADKYFDKGWSSIGMAESTLASKNYLLKKDLRKYAPFCIKHHNPQRNLYQTLGMKGDELPKIRTRSQQDLIDIGIKRTGWTASTVFIDLPLTFEDQILIDKNKWKNRTYSLNKVYTVHGKIFVKEGQKLIYGDVLGISLDEHPVIVDMLGEKLEVDKINIKYIVIEGIAHTVYSIKIKITRKFKEGFKITNLSGNKGICRLIKDLGVIKDPVKGDTSIDVIVSVSSVNKRKNFGQICEAVMSRIIEKDPLIIKDDAEFGIEDMRKLLLYKGYSGDTPEKVDIETPFGKFKAIWGNVFWGCIKSPEDQLWLPGETNKTNSKKLRKAGLKFSSVEIRAISTSSSDTSIETNPIIKDIMGYQQGVNYLQSKLLSLKFLDYKGKCE